ncbi:MAG: rod shape-determining protein MreC [Gammaproteobacteria bacterium]|nr:rod shape-determining protein MreC [Gammaproteobacteria bacterium]MYF68058.1 rod shape-determining protein MreC [Gammaproteobacteria bacterium]MYK37660.1 rod shape-determining protein MreC [Gammaproteobacteria bacterium]
MTRWTATLRADRFRRRKGPSRAGECLLICLLSFGLLVVEANFPAVQKVRGVGELMLVPVQATVRLVSGGFRGVQGYFRDQSSLMRENQDLRTQLLRQDVDLQQMAALKSENEVLRSLHTLNAQLGSDNLTAETLPGNPDPSRHRVTLNKGSRQGAYIGQPVVDSGGVVGQVTRDYLVTSEALLISDANHALPVMFERTGLQAIALGTGRRDHRLLLPFVPAHADVNQGDTVVSSGSGGLFPAGLRVGVVEDVRNSSGEAFLEAFVTPSANLESPRQVLLLRSEPLQPGAEPGPVNGDSPAAAAGS